MGHPPVVLGLDFGGTKIAVAVCDLAGVRLASATVAAGGHDPAAEVFQRGIETARGLLASAAAGRELVAVGVSTFGIPYEDRVELAPAIDGWESLALGRELRAAFDGAAVELATDAKAAAAAEARWGALRGCDPGVYINLGTGLSAAIVAGGQVISGANGAAGEFGYNLLTRSDVGLALDERTMLEEMVSGLALARRASGPAGQPPRRTAADVFAAGPDDPELGPLIAEFTDELAFHLTNLAILVNPVRIAVGGGLVKSWDRIEPVLRAALRSGPPFPPELVVGQYPYDAPLIGAIALAVGAAAAQPAAGQLTAVQPAAIQPATGQLAATPPAGIPLAATPLAATPLAVEPQVTGITTVMSGTLNNNTGVEA